MVDAAHVVTVEEEGRLTTRLETLERETSTQIVIATARKEYPAVPPQSSSRPSSRPSISFGGLAVMALVSGIIGNAMGAFAAAVLGGFFGLVLTGFAWWGIPLERYWNLFTMAMFRGGARRQPRRLDLPSDVRWELGYGGSLESST